MIHTLDTLAYVFSSCADETDKTGGLVADKDKNMDACERLIKLESVLSEQFVQFKRVIQDSDLTVPLVLIEVYRYMCCV